MDIKDVIVIGGGQSALACGYYLRRTKLNYLILDKQKKCGGSWQESWDSLTLFSPSEQSSLPGWLMQKSRNEFPSRDEVVQYLCNYEKRYKLVIERPVEVKSVRKEDGIFILQTDKGEFFSKAIISATGTWERPSIPDVPGRSIFEGKQLHTKDYRNPEEFRDQKILVVGEGNSGAQILSDVSKTAETAWATLREPDFLPDDVDGRVLFNAASAKYYAEQKGEKFNPAKFSLGHIVVVPSVKDARHRGVLQSKGRFTELYKHGVIWETGEKEPFDAIIWCTGFRYATHHLEPLVIRDTRGKINTNGTRAIEEPGAWMVGYGVWTGFASATLIGVGRSAKKTVKEILEFLS